MSEQKLKKQILQDLVKMLNAGVTDESLSCFFSKPCSWWWSGHRNKPRQYEHCPFWSEAAYQQWAANSEKNKFKWLRYEHVVPVNALSKSILDLRDSGKIVQEEELLGLLEEWCHACVIQKDEHKLLKPKDSMPDDWDKKDIWARYRNAMKTGKIKIGAFQNNKWQPINL